jgi:riboflavin kinase/FMN adenylyltransferase
MPTDQPAQQPVFTFGLYPPPVSQTRIFVRGVVERGDQRGRLLGFPTANVLLEDDAVGLRDGVYAGYTYCSDGRPLQCAISVGRRTTFYAVAGQRLLEAHVIDFDNDLYDQVITVELATLLREQQTFDGVDTLRSQLSIDRLRAIDALSSTQPSGFLASNVDGLDLRTGSGER